MQKASLCGMRKGSWTEEEDVLLRSCVQRYGEGEWHRVPQRAGLNRCRKSCRLRWLNYLKPNIKRGKFQDDEVDMIIRLHKLLGNRWSLIAGRLPGRTANNVKNYWNTHARKMMTCQGKPENEKPQDLVKVEVIKPRPRTISKNLSSLGPKPVGSRTSPESSATTRRLQTEASGSMMTLNSVRRLWRHRWIVGADSPSTQKVSGTGLAEI